MFGRRVPPHTLFTVGLIVTVLAAVGAFFAFQAHAWVWFGLLAILTVWFAVDTVRSYGWMQNKKLQDAEKKAQQQR